MKFKRHIPEKRLGFRWLVLAALASAGPVRALELITPVSVHSSVNDAPAPVGPDYFPAGNLITNAGLPGGAEATAATYQTLRHDNFSSSTAWVTQDPAPAGGDWYAEGNPAPVLTFQFPAQYRISHLVVWGYANASQNNNEARSFQIELSADGGVTWSPPQEVIHQRTGRDQETLELPSPGSADMVRMTVTGNFSGTAGASGGDRVGLGEVKFLGEASADPLLGTIALISRPMGLAEEFAIPVRNHGATRTLTFSSVTFSGPDAAKFSLAAPAAPLAPGAESLVRVAMDGSAGFETISATVELNTDDSATPQKTVLITGPRRASSLLITPAGVASSTDTLSAPAGPDLYPAINLINNSSLAGGEALTADNYQTVTHPTTSATTAWVTTAPGGAGSNWYADDRPEPVLTFTLDQPYVLTGAAIWGYGSPNNNEARTVRVALSTDGGTTWGPEQTILRQRTGPAQHTVDLPQPGLADAVRFTFQDNFFAVPGIHGGGDRVGLGEVKFLGQRPRDPFVHTPAKILRPFAAIEEFEVVVRNLGTTRNLTLGAPSFAGPGASKFSVAASPAAIAPGMTGTIRVLFDSGGDPAAVDASLLIPNDDAQVVLLPVSLAGPLQNPRIAVEPAALDFGTPAGGTGGKAITVRNVGTETVFLTPEVWGPAGTLYTLNMDTGSQLDPGSSVEGMVTFNGSGAYGSLPATLVFRSADPVQPALRVPLSAAMPPGPRLVAYWPFNEEPGAVTAADAAGTHTGTAENVTFGAEAPPVAYAGTGASFDGVSSRVLVEHSPDLNTGSFTVTLWAKLNAAPAAGVYVSPLTNRDDATGINAGNHGFILYANGTTWQFWSGNESWGSLGSAFTVGAWQHLALSYDGTTRIKRLYVNGVQTGITATAYSPNGPQRERLYLGAGSDNGSTFHWPGGIDEVALFRDALTAAEIQTVMNEGLASFLPPAGETFSVTAFTFNARTGAAEVSWESVDGESYRVESSTTLQGVWNPVATGVNATGTTTSWSGTITPPAEGRLFVRVVRL